ncbi:IS66 family insertion sequence hypothetical protein [Mesorhizobium loti]|nr:IS66 family insertion sequence hypothetical protein [Mesorhizobium loti]PBB83435.1 IS66 family insertion sequence hypothetical protein [Mesorhizobium sp. WSM3876]
MIPGPNGVRVWLATGHTDIGKGFPGLALVVQETLKRDPHNGHLFVFRDRRGDLIKVLWHDGQGACLFSKKLERGRFIWQSPVDGVITITPAQLVALLDLFSRGPAKLNEPIVPLEFEFVANCRANHVPAGGGEHPFDDPVRGQDCGRLSGHHGAFAPPGGITAIGT